MQESNLLSKLPKNSQKNDFFQLVALRRGGETSQNLPKLGTYLNWTLFHILLVELRILMSASGFLFDFIQSDFFFGHFGRQELKILKFHRQTFCSKITKEDDETSQKF